MRLVVIHDLSEGEAKCVDETQGEHGTPLRYGNDDRGRGWIYWSTPVVLRLGTNPTGMRATSFRDLISTTETSFVTGFATYAVLPSGVSVTQPAPLPFSSAPPSSFSSGSEYAYR